MNQSNYNKLFLPDGTDIKAIFEQNTPEAFKQMLEAPSKHIAKKIIEENHTTIPDGLKNKIQLFIQRKRADGIAEERIKRLVKKKFHITVV